MADYKLKVTTKELTTKAANFKTTSDNVHTKTQSMLTTVRSMTGNIWSGDAQSAYLKKFNQLENDMTQMKKMIDEYYKDLIDIAKNYDTAETNNKEAVNSLSGNPIV